MKDFATKYLNMGCLLELELTKVRMLVLLNTRCTQEELAVEVEWDEVYITKESIGCGMTYVFTGCISFYYCLFIGWKIGVYLIPTMILIYFVYKSFSSKNTDSFTFILVGVGPCNHHLQTEHNMTPHQL